MGRLGPWAIPILLLIAGFRMPGYLSSAMSVPLFKSLHISDTDIATVTKLFGFWVALGGTFLASYIVRTVGLVTSLLVGTVVGSASHMSSCVAGRDRSGRLAPLRHCCQRGKIGLFLCAGRAHHLHVFARLD